MPHDKKDFPHKDAVVLATNVAAVLAAHGTDGFVLPVGTGVAVFAGYVLTLWDRLNQDKAANDYVAFVEQWAFVHEMPAAEAEAEVRRLMTVGDPAHDEKLYEAFRHRAFLRSAAAWPYIARMTAMYAREGRAADDFFRRMGWLLERCETNDIEAIYKASRATAEALGKHGGTAPKVHWSALGDGVDVHIVTPTQGTSPWLDATGASTASVQAVDLLAEARVARPLNTGLVELEGYLLDGLLALFNR